MSRKGFNKRHPELRKGEVFLTNASHDDGWKYEDNKSSWDSIGWKTKRNGSIAYDIDGNPLNGRGSKIHHFPVFVSKRELEKERMDTSDM